MVTTLMGMLVVVMSVMSVMSGGSMGWFVVVILWVVFGEID